MGFFLDCAQDEGFEVEGLEFSGYAVGRGNQKYAFPVKKGNIKDVQLMEARYDAVVLLDVIEHLKDPFGVIMKIATALKVGGIVAVVTMDSTSLTSRLLGRRLEDFRRIREHLYFFSRSSLRVAMRKEYLQQVHVMSIGHTFPVEILLPRLRTVSGPLYWIARAITSVMGVSDRSVYLNPRTKFIGLYRKEPSTK